MTLTLTYCPIILIIQVAVSEAEQQVFIIISNLVKISKNARP